MIEKMMHSENNILAIEVIDGFTETDEKLAQKFFNEKVQEGYQHVHVLIKLDEMKLSHSSTKAFMEDMIWVLRNYKHMGNLAIVAHSNILKALVPIDNFFFERLQRGFEERYFDKSQLKEAMAFLQST